MPETLRGGRGFARLGPRGKGKGRHVTVAPVIQKETPSIEIPVTAGNLKNGHVYLREFLWFFPKESIRGKAGDSAESLPCTLELAGLGTVETEIDADKAIFRWRGWKKFFQRHRELYVG